MALLGGIGGGVTRDVLLNKIPGAFTAVKARPLRRRAMIDDGFVGYQAGLAFSLDRTSALDPKTAALLQFGASVAAGSAGVPGMERHRGAGGGRDRG